MVTPVSEDGKAILHAHNIEIHSGFLGAHPETNIAPSSCWYGPIHADRPLTLGSYSYSWSPISPHLRSVGRYCSFAAGIAMGDVEHPIDRLSTSPFTYDGSFIFERHLRDRKTGFQLDPWSNKGDDRQIVIGNDVWIGHGAYIKDGVTIGTGAIIGRGAVVTKDVPPYAVVVGNPGVIKKMRFKDEYVSELMEMRWWEYDYADFAGIDLTDIKSAIENLWQRLPRLLPERLTYIDARDVMGGWTQRPNVSPVLPMGSFVAESPKERRDLAMTSSRAAP